MKIVLINSEGNILALDKINNKFNLIDEFDVVLIEDISKHEIINEFLTGNVSYVDSKNRTWNYLNVPKDMRGDKEIIIKNLR